MLWYPLKAQKVKDVIDAFLAEFMDEVSSESAVEAFGELKRVSDEVFKTVATAKVFLIEVLLAKAVKQLDKAVEDYPEHQREEAVREQEKAKSVIQQQLAWLTSNKFGVSEADCEKHLIECAKSKLG